ncbi:MAG: HD domain-containing protein, partial [Pseudomonadota bacterium]|nr:HD domain-containing protein [Pseudomonadota bacterium]
KEAAAATRLFGLLPPDPGAEYRALWQEFEAAESADAQFAKAIDRFQTPVANLASDGGTWADYNVTMDQMETRVGTPVKRGAPGLWAWMRPRLVAWFARA